MLTTTVRPTAGRAWVAGVDVAAAPARVHRHIGVVPQRNTLDRRLSVRDNLVFHGRYFGMRLMPCSSSTLRGRAREAVRVAALRAVMVSAPTWVASIGSLHVRYYVHAEVDREGFVDV